MKELSKEEIQNIRKNPNNQYWIDISYFDELSEDFIREFEDYVEWTFISYRQNLSKEFIAEFINKINFKRIILNKNISDEVKDYCRMFI